MPSIWLWRSPEVPEMNCPMSDDVLCGGDDGPPPKRIQYCPKCNSEMIDRLPRVSIYGQRFENLHLLNWLCMTCGHEEKVKP